MVSILKQTAPMTRTYLPMWLSFIVKLINPNGFQNTTIINHVQTISFKRYLGGNTCPNHKVFLVIKAFYTYERSSVKYFFRFQFILMNQEN